MGNLFEVTAQVADSCVVLVCSGEFDLAAVDDFMACASTVATSEHRIVVDLRAVAFMDSSALNALLWLREAAGGREVSVREPTDAIRHLFEITGLSAVFAIEQSD